MRDSLEGMIREKGVTSFRFMACNGKSRETIIPRGGVARV